MTHPFRPTASPEEAITVHIAENEAKGIPATRIYLYSSDSEDTTNPKVITMGSVRILNRHRRGCNDYAMEDIGASITYNEDKQIVKIDLYEGTIDERATELERFLELSKDKQACMAYRLLAWYWSSITFGYIFIHGIEDGSISADVLGISDSEESD